MPAKKKLTYVGLVGFQVLTFCSHVLAWGMWWNEFGNFRTWPLQRGSCLIETLLTVSSQSIWPPLSCGGQVLNGGTECLISKQIQSFWVRVEIFGWRHWWNLLGKTNCIDFYSHWHYCSWSSPKHKSLPEGRKCSEILAFFPSLNRWETSLSYVSFCPRRSIRCIYPQNKGIEPGISKQSLKSMYRHCNRSLQTPGQADLSQTSENPMWKEDWEPNGLTTPEFPDPLPGPSLEGQQPLSPLERTKWLFRIIPGSVMATEDKRGIQSTESTQVNAAKSQFSLTFPE